MGTLQATFLEPPTRQNVVNIMFVEWEASLVLLFGALGSRYITRTQVSPLSKPLHLAESQASNHLKKKTKNCLISEALSKGIYFYYRLWILIFIMDYYGWNIC